MRGAGSKRRAHSRVALLLFVLLAIACLSFFPAYRRVFYQPPTAITPGGKQPRVGRRQLDLVEHPTMANSNHSAVSSNNKKMTLPPQTTGRSRSRKREARRPATATPVLVEGDLSMNSTLLKALLLTKETGARGGNAESPDVELFVLWYGSHKQWSKILKDIARRFVVLDITRYDWISEHAKDNASHHYFQENLWRLYSGKGGWKQKGMPLKVKQCGKGPFLSVVVVDPNPHMTQEKTAHGVDTVSHNMHVAKTKYRKMAGGGFKVHGTFSPEEARHDILMLYSKPMVRFLPTTKEEISENVRGLTGRFLAEDYGATAAADEKKKNAVSKGKETPPTFGFHGWLSCHELLMALDSLPKGSAKVVAPQGSCESWPSSESGVVRVSVAETSRWAVVATFYGHPAAPNGPRGKGAGHNKEPTEFLVVVGGEEYRFVVAVV